MQISSVFFLIAAEAVSVDVCRVHELPTGFLLLALAFTFKS
jgi:hypothetical protein